MGNIGKGGETEKIQLNKVTEICNERRNEEGGGPY
jgi:hypothetical protein